MELQIKSFKIQKSIINITDFSISLKSVENLKILFMFVIIDHQTIHVSQVNTPIKLSTNHEIAVTMLNSVAIQTYS